MWGYLRVFCQDSQGDFLYYFYPKQTNHLKQKVSISIFWKLHRYLSIIPHMNLEQRWRELKCADPHGCLYPSLQFGGTIILVKTVGVWSHTILAHYPFLRCLFLKTSVCWHWSLLWPVVCPGEGIVWVSGPSSERLCFSSHSLWTSNLKKFLLTLPGKNWGVHAGSTTAWDYITTAHIPGDSSWKHQLHWKSTADEKIGKKIRHEVAVSNYNTGNHFSLWCQVTSIYWSLGSGPYTRKGIGARKKKSDYQVDCTQMAQNNSSHLYL